MTNRRINSTIRGLNEVRQFFITCKSESIKMQNTLTNYGLTLSSAIEVIKELTEELQRISESAEAIRTENIQLKEDKLYPIVKGEITKFIDDLIARLERTRDDL